MHTNKSLYTRRITQPQPTSNRRRELLNIFSTNLTSSSSLSGFLAHTMNESPLPSARQDWHTKSVSRGAIIKKRRLTARQVKFIKSSGGAGPKRRSLLLYDADNSSRMPSGSTETVERASTFYRSSGASRRSSGAFSRRSTVISTDDSSKLPSSLVDVPPQQRAMMLMMAGSPVSASVSGPSSPQLLAVAGNASTSVYPTAIAKLSNLHRVEVTEDHVITPRVAGTNASVSPLLPVSGEGPQKESVYAMAVGDARSFPRPESVIPLPPRSKVSLAVGIPFQYVFYRPKDEKLMSSNDATPLQHTTTRAATAAPQGGENVSSFLLSRHTTFLVDGAAESGASGDPFQFPENESHRTRGDQSCIGSEEEGAASSSAYQRFSKGLGLGNDSAVPRGLGATISATERPLDRLSSAPRLYNLSRLYEPPARPLHTLALWQRSLGNPLEARMDHYLPSHTIRARAVLVHGSRSDRFLAHDFAAMKCHPCVVRLYTVFHSTLERMKMVVRQELVAARQYVMARVVTAWQRHARISLSESSLDCLSEPHQRQRSTEESTTRASRHLESFAPDRLNGALRDTVAGARWEGESLISSTDPSATRRSMRLKLEYSFPSGNAPSPVLHSRAVSAESGGGVVEDLELRLTPFQALLLQSDEAELLELDVDASHAPFSHLLLETLQSFCAVDICHNIGAGLSLASEETVQPRSFEYSATGLETLETQRTAGLPYLGVQLMQSGDDSDVSIMGASNTFLSSSVLTTNPGCTLDQMKDDVDASVPNRASGDTRGSDEGNNSVPAVAPSPSPLFLIAVASPHVSEGHIGMVFNRWVRTTWKAAPQFPVAEVEMVIRNILLSVLHELRALHLKGTPHGAVTITNIFSTSYTEPAANECRSFPAHDPSAARNHSISQGIHSILASPLAPKTNEFQRLESYSFFPDAYSEQPNASIADQSPPIHSTRSSSIALPPSRAVEYVLRVASKRQVGASATSPSTTEERVVLGKLSAPSCTLHCMEGGISTTDLAEMRYSDRDNTDAATAASPSSPSSPSAPPSPPLPGDGYLGSLLSSEVPPTPASLPSVAAAPAAANASGAESAVLKSPLPSTSGTDAGSMGTPRWDRTTHPNTTSWSKAVVLEDRTHRRVESAIGATLAAELLRSLRNMKSCSTDKEDPTNVSVMMEGKFPVGAGGGDELAGTAWMKSLDAFPPIETSSIPPPEWIQPESELLRQLSTELRDTIWNDEADDLDRLCAADSPFRTIFPNSVRPTELATTKSDVWMVGILALELTRLAEEAHMSLGHHLNAEPVLQLSNNKLWSFEKQPIPVLSSTMWSSHLRLFVHRCVRPHPNHRPSVGELLKDSWFSADLCAEEKVALELLQEAAKAATVPLRKLTIAEPLSTVLPHDMPTWDASGGVVTSPLTNSKENTCRTEKGQEGSSPCFLLRQESQRHVCFISYASLLLAYHDLASRTTLQLQEYFSQCCVRQYFSFLGLEGLSMDKSSRSSHSRWMGHSSTESVSHAASSARSCDERESQDSTKPFELPATLRYLVPRCEERMNKLEQAATFHSLNLYRHPTELTSGTLSTGNLFHSIASPTADSITTVRKSTDVESNSFARTATSLLSTMRYPSRSATQPQKLIKDKYKSAQRQHLSCSSPNYGVVDEVSYQRADSSLGSSFSGRNPPCSSPPTRSESSLCSLSHNSFSSDSPPLRQRSGDSGDSDDNSCHSSVPGLHINMLDIDEPSRGSKRPEKQWYDAMTTPNEPSPVNAKNRLTSRDTANGPHHQRRSARRGEDVEEKATLWPLVLGAFASAVDACEHMDGAAGSVKDLESLLQLFISLPPQAAEVWSACLLQQLCRHPGTQEMVAGLVPKDLWAASRQPSVSSEQTQKANATPPPPLAEPNPLEYYPCYYNRYAMMKWSLESTTLLASEPQWEPMSPAR